MNYCCCGTSVLPGPLPCCCHWLLVAMSCASILCLSLEPPLGFVALSGGGFSGVLLQLPFRTPWPGSVLGHPGVLLLTCGYGG